MTWTNICMLERKKKFLLLGAFSVAGIPCVRGTVNQLSAADALSHEPGRMSGRIRAFSRGENPFYRMAQQKLPKILKCTAGMTEIIRGIIGPCLRGPAQCSRLQKPMFPHLVKALSSTPGKSPSRGWPYAFRSSLQCILPT